MTEPKKSFDELPAERQKVINRECDVFEALLRQGKQPDIEEILSKFTSQPISEQRALLACLLELEVEYNDATEIGLRTAPFMERFPDSENVVNAVCIALQLPKTIGRYELLEQIGAGGFGRVFVAADSQLGRKVAIKIPHVKLGFHIKTFEACLDEARVVAQFDHENIVSVYDVGQLADGRFYIVSQFIDGADLKKWISDKRPSLTSAMELVAKVAGALHYAHVRGVFHRDVKPANILIDVAGKPYVTDFGLSLRSEDVGIGTNFVGTPGYMSPEQARGESHLVNGQSDIFSLGVVLYELVTGHHPFSAGNATQVIERIKTCSFQPPRQRSENISLELERICLKALSKHACDRYSSAFDMMDDLRQLLRRAEEHSPKLDLSEKRIEVVPKGLRSFDEGDAEFFAQLLPGPRDRNGLPESIRFWKLRIEECEVARTFRLGFIFGPSGCGKTSLMRAGILPRLGLHVRVVYVEATGSGTELSLLTAIRRRCPEIPDVGLVETLSALRCTEGDSSREKVLLVIDQFEQWLHQSDLTTSPELVQALRQCDGEHVQCILIVRDDFWMAANQFMDHVDEQVVSRSNIMGVDLFDLDHARKVLELFGTSYASPSRQPSQSELKSFVNEAVDGLSIDGRVSCVRLALFAEMFKSKQWTRDNLRAVGGPEGIGVTFLEEALEGPKSNPRLRTHRKAARAVLKTLLPEFGSRIKSSPKSYQCLAEAAGYSDKLKDFEVVIHLLDAELRLITPVDVERYTEDGEIVTNQTAPKRFQLTHDFLIPSIRTWLTNKQRATRRGRTEILLSERAELWNAGKEHARLPSAWQCLAICCFTSAKQWTDSQRRMMQQAFRHHLLRFSFITAGLVALLLGVGVLYTRLRAEGMVSALLSSDPSKVLQQSEKVAAFPFWTKELLNKAIRESEPESSPALFARIALLSSDARHVESVSKRALNSEVEELALVCRALKNAQIAPPISLQDVLTDQDVSDGQRFRALCVLTNSRPLAHEIQTRMEPHGNALASYLVRVTAKEPRDFRTWVELAEPCADQLKPFLIGISRDATSLRDKLSATNVLLDLGVGADEQANMLMRANEDQFRMILERRIDAPPLRKILRDQLKETYDAPRSEREALASRRANAAIALLRFRDTAGWSVLKHSRDPTAQSYFIHRAMPYGVTPEFLVGQLIEENEACSLRALILAVGHGIEAVGRETRERFHNILSDLYFNDPDSGVHAAARWSLHKMGADETRENLDDAAYESPDQNRAWYVTSQGQTMVVVRSRSFLMGSPSDEPGRRSLISADVERRHFRHIGRVFAISSCEITVNEFKKFKHHDYDVTWAPSDSCPIGRVSWFDAAQYCNWLSKQEGIDRDEWCYITNDKDEYGPGMRPKDNFMSLTGYRLPGEAEWEYSCRANTDTSRYFGSCEELLPHYGVYGTSYARPVASLKPNAFGLFDMLGNAYERCHDYYDKGAYLQKQVERDRRNAQVVEAKSLRILRGSSAEKPPTVLRSAMRDATPADNRSSGIGFRVARTLPSR